ncbi:hypothetical protein RFI_18575 [Reticulomyxa filosa]|uniref:Uncharacterized protein n=1 Tax=Reticulomyxa filosa TaxID=46433 RepID=X6MXC6_RETFI|nr:hypothetical protein RFI_18575 [Reticulomyxa filosa]|eukprot:ETO18680.1 hypothetical protein RFI_18575 [Reticulomyxa filosa]
MHAVTTATNDNIEQVLKMWESQTRAKENSVDNNKNEILKKEDIELIDKDTAALVRLYFNDPKQVFSFFQQEINFLLCLSSIFVCYTNTLIPDYRVQVGDFSNRQIVQDKKKKRKTNKKLKMEKNEEMFDTLFPRNIQIERTSNSDKTCIKHIRLE